VLQESIERKHQDARAADLCDEWATAFGAQEQPELQLLSAFDSTFAVTESIAEASGHPSREIDAGADDYAALCVFHDHADGAGHFSVSVLDADGSSAYIAQWPPE
jgi:hypothetical protein